MPNSAESSYQNRTRHRRKRSSVASISALAAANSGKILAYQSTERMHQELALPAPEFAVTSITVHSTPAVAVVHLECFSPYGHWFSEKKLGDFVIFDKLLEKVFPVEAGRKGGKRIAPKPPMYCHLPEAIIRICGPYLNCSTSTQTYLTRLLTCSTMLSRSQLLNQFLKSSIIEPPAEEYEEAPFSIMISSPWIDSPKMYCAMTEHQVQPTPRNRWIELHVNGIVFPISNLDNICMTNISKLTGVSRECLPYKSDEDLYQFVEQYKLGKNSGTIHIR